MELRELGLPSHAAPTALYRGMENARTKTLAMEFEARRPAESSGGVVSEHIDDEPTWPYERTDVFMGRTRTEYLPRNPRS